ncbi:hypothetical protein ABS71_13735 [bacterium SCN 62-11]|nr:MAG: hypothetical protein ABS71_13735 [bacterium SCN 62-11]
MRSYVRVGGQQLETPVPIQIHQARAVESRGHQQSLALIDLNFHDRIGAAQVVKHNSLGLSVATHIASFFQPPGFQG